MSDATGTFPSASPDPTVRPSRSRGRRRPLTRTLTSLLLSVSVVAGTGLETLGTASAQTPSSSVIAAVDALKDAGHLQVNSAQSKSTTLSYRESSAAFRFLTKTLGLSLGTSPTVTGTKDGKTLDLTVGTSHPFLKLPDGIASPLGATATVRVNTKTNVETVTSASPSGSVTITLDHASTTSLTDGKGVTGQITDRVSLFNSTEVLSGSIADEHGPRLSPYRAACRRPPRRLAMSSSQEGRS